MKPLAEVSSGISVKVSLLGGEQANLKGTLSHSDFSTKNIFTPSLLSLPFAPGSISQQEPYVWSSLKSEITHMSVQSYQSLDQCAIP